MLNLHARIMSAARGDKRKCNSNDLYSFLSRLVVWNCAQRHAVFDRGIKNLQSDYVGLAENVSPLNTEKLVRVAYILTMTGSNLISKLLLYFLLFSHISFM
jgi:hypothetical protein